MCCRELEHEVRTTERGRPPRRENRLGLPAVRFVVRASLDATGQAQWEAARRKMQEETGRVVTDAEVLAHLAKAFLGGEETSASSTYQVVVQQCPQCKGAAVETEEGAVPLEQPKAAMVACDGEHVGLGQPMDQPTPAWLRRAVLARDGRRCRSCRSGGDLMVHHIRFRSRGGPSRADNLVTLCCRCHALVHEGLPRVEGRNARSLRFVGDGRSVAEFDGSGSTVLEILGRGARAPGKPESVPTHVDAAWWRAHEDRLVWNGRSGHFTLRSTSVTLPKNGGKLPSYPPLAVWDPPTIGVAGRASAASIRT